MPQLSPYRSLPLDRRVALVAFQLANQRGARTAFIQRLCSRGGGFRPATFQSWPAERLAKEVVRLKVESGDDEFGLMQTLYVDMDPSIQAVFLDTAGVKHTNGRMEEDAEPPFADAAAVTRAALALGASHGEDGLRYLRTIQRYAADAWPGLDNALAGMGEHAQG